MRADRTGIHTPTRTCIIVMNEPAAMIRLQTMLSPAFPVGSFAYSGGLERAVADGLVVDGSTLGDWLATVLETGSLWNDAVLAAESWRRSRGAADLSDLNELAIALAGSAGRHLESTAQGGAFAQAAAVWAEGRLVPAGAAAYPVAVGRVAAANGVALDDMLAMFLNAALSSLVQATIRLAVVGQSGGLRALADLEPAILAAAARAAQSSLDDLGGAALMAEIAVMNQETLATRVFRT